MLYNLIKWSLGPLGSVLLFFHPEVLAAQPPLFSEPVSNWERNCFWGLEMMGESQNLSEIQVSGIRHDLQEERSMIDLFEHHGLLSPDEMKDKTREILDVTQAKIDLALTPKQLKCWNDWMRSFEMRGFVRQPSDVAVSPRPN